MIKFVFLAILTCFDFIIYLLPMYIFGLIINFIITLVWYFPSIYQLYSFIFIEKEYDLRIRIYLMLLSPIIIILYIPFTILDSVGYNIFFLLVNPLIIIIRRPSYPLYSLSSTAATIHLIYKYICGHSIEEFLVDFLVLEQIKGFIQLTGQYWKFHSARPLEKIKHKRLCVYGLKLIILFLDLFIILLIYIMLIIPYIVIVVGIIYNLLIGIIWKYYMWYHEYEDKTMGICEKIRFILLTHIRIISFLILELLCISTFSFIMIIRIIGVYIKSHNGFYDVMGFLLVFVIKPFLKSRIGDFIYICCRINVRYRKDMLHQIFITILGLQVYLISPERTVRF